MLPFAFEHTLVRHQRGERRDAHISQSSGSQQMVNPVVFTIYLHNVAQNFTADNVLRSYDRHKIAELIFHLEDVALELLRCFQG